MYFIPILLFSLIYGSEAINNTQTALVNFATNLLPVLLPYTILANIITKSIPTKSNTHMKMLFCIFLGFLCGFPVGSIFICNFYRKEELTKIQATFLFMFCNQFSPAFLTNLLFPATNLHHKLPFYFAIYGIPTIYAIFFLLLHHKEMNISSKQADKYSTEPRKQKRYHINKILTQISFAKNTSESTNYQIIGDSCIAAFQTLSKICGCIILCQTIILIPKHAFPMLVPYLTPLLEINSGLVYFQSFSPATTMAYATFGGICCMLQVGAIMSETDLSLQKYLKHKLIQALITYLIFHGGMRIFPNLFS